jgi:predicted transposase/invertase (TIGR01784 family)
MKLHNLWLRFLTEIRNGDEHVPEELLEDAEIRRAVELLEESAYTDAELAAYEKNLDVIRTERSVKSDARREGRAEGLAEGIEKGLAEGRAEGIERMRRTVINMYGQHIPVETIAACTNLSIEEVESILTALPG